MSNNWADRRGMFQKGKELHEPGRRLSQTGIVESVRRASVSSNEGGVQKVASNSAVAEPITPTSPIGQRRRSSAASGGLFGNLNTMKRGSQDYGDRRGSHTDMMAGSPTLMSGWYNKTFRGMEKPQVGAGPATQPSSQTTAQPNKRGVME